MKRILTLLILLTSLVSFAQLEEKIVKAYGNVSLVTNGKVLIEDSPQQMGVLLTKEKCSIWVLGNLDTRTFIYTDVIDYDPVTGDLWIYETDDNGKMVNYCRLQNDRFSISITQNGLTSTYFLTNEIK